jgi:hypothetical protein
LKGAVPLAVALVAGAGLALAGHDGDGDGWPDTFGAGGVALHVVTSRVPATEPREYDVPPNYGVVIASKAFLYDKRFLRLQSDRRAAATSARHVATGLVVDTQVSDHDGRTSLAITVGGHAASTAAERQAVAEAFACYEDLLFNGLPIPR